MKYTVMNRRFAPFYDFFNLFRYSHIEPNWHDELEIIFMIKGCGEFIIDGNPVTLKEREIMLINPRVPHSMKKSDTASATSLTVSGDFLASNGFGVINGTFKEITTDKHLSELFKKFYFSYYSMDKYREAKLRIALLEMLTYIFENFYTQNKFFDRNEKINGILNYLNNNYTESITLEDLAKRFNYSKSHLATVFKNTTEVTITRYVNTLRCNYAASLLKNTALPIKDIAIMCGFSTTDGFAKAYKQIRGRTPGATRAEHRNFLADGEGLGKPLIIE